MTEQRQYRHRIAVGLVGVGEHAYRTILPALTYLPVTLVAVCDTDRRRAEATASQYGVQAVYEEPDDLIGSGDVAAVLLCISGRVHPKLATKALRAGLHVWMEKPPALSRSDVEEMLAARGDRVCVVGLKKAFMPAAAKMREILAEAGGDLVSLLGTYPLSVPVANSAELNDSHGGTWMADACHPLSLMVSVGGSVRSIRTLRGTRPGGACILEFAGGAIGNLHLSKGAPWSQPFERYVAYGDGFSIEIENSRRVVFQRGIPADYATATTFAPRGTDHGALVWEAQSSFSSLDANALFVQGVYGELHHFCDRILNSAAPAEGTLEQAREVMRLVEAAIESDGDAVALQDAAT